MGFFSSKKEDKLPEWYAQVKENQERFFVFLDKMENKMMELCEASIPELTELYKNDPDIFHREYGRLKAGVLGQLEQIREKVDDVHEEKILDLYSEINHSGVRATHPHYGLLNDFRNQCGDRYRQQFEVKLEEWTDKINETSAEDLEIKYQNVLKEYDAIKGKFTCKQCGSPITIEKIFLIETFVNCPSCNTQNTFSPSTQAQMLQHFAQDLARQRTASLYQAIRNAEQKERDLYQKMHELKLKITFEKDKKLAAQYQQQRDVFEKERQEAIDSLPVLNEQYTRAKYAEWIKIVPDFKEHLLTRMENDLGAASPRW